MRARDTAYAPVLVLAMGMMLVRILIMARLLPVDQFAVYSLGLLISTSFCMLGCLGLQPLLQRELPIQIIRGRERAGVISSTQCIVVATVSAVVLALPAAWWGTWSGLTVQLAPLGLFHGLSQQVFLIATVESRSRGATMRFAQGNLARAIGVIVAGVLAVTLGGEGGAVLMTEAVVSIAAAATLWYAHVRTASMEWMGTVTLAMRRLPRKRWRAAFSLMSVMMLSVVMMNADRWIAAEVFTTSQFAQYSFAWIVLMVAHSTQAVINASVFPRLAHRFATDGSQAAFRLAAQTSVSLAAVGALAVMPAWAALNGAIRGWFPVYEPSLVLMPAFLLVAILRVSDFWSSYLIIVGREAHLFRHNLGLIAVVGAVWWSWAATADGATELVDVAALPVLLACPSYATVLLIAWRVAREQGGPV